MARVPPPRAPSYAPKSAADAALEGIAMGDKIVDRLAFWSAFGLLAWPIQNFLCNRLDAISYTLEQFVAWRDAPPPHGGSGVRLAGTAGTTTTFPVTTTAGSTGYLPSFSGPPAPPEPPKVWGKNGTFTDAEIFEIEMATQHCYAEPDRPSLFTLERAFKGSRWWCSRCNGFFPDGQLAKMHVCQ